MKLADALLLRADYQQKLINIQNRLMQNIKVQEGDDAHEEPQALLDEMLMLNDKLAELIKKINYKNMMTRLEDGRTIAEAIVDRDILNKKRQALNSVAEHAMYRDYRMTRGEIKMKVSVNIAELQKQIDHLARDSRELDAKIQATNWLTSFE